MPIAQWLEKLGMSEYIRRFAEHNVDLSVLGDLSEQDLKELGISVGHRRKILAAIRELPGIPPAATEAAAVVPDVQNAAERRQLTVLFSDLVGSTELSGRMDPEDLRELISAYNRCVAETVRRFGGFVAKYMGDGVLVYFGYPHAHEDDAEQAVRAGLELTRAVAGLETRAPLQARVGIATGVVVVGDLIGMGEVERSGVVGETPNLAARLQGIANPGTVLIAEGTRKLLGDFFELNDLGTMHLKGVSRPVPVWLVLRTSPVVSRFEALHPGALTPLVGRKQETELLLRLWSKAKASEGQVVLLSGEAGIGKSRLAAALLQEITSEPHTLLQCFCSARHTDSALYPIIGWIERAAGLAYNDSMQTKLDKLDALLTRTATPDEDAELFADILLLRNDGRYRRLNLSAAQRRDKTLEALTKQIEALARVDPLLMIFEDAHWADPTSLEALSQAVNRIGTHRVLLIVTFRPGFARPWTGQQYVTALGIDRLGPREVSVIIDRLVGNKSLAESVRTDIITRTDGIPLFVEEITKAVLEAETQRAAEHANVAMSPRAPAVPASLQASLLERLDQLGPAKQLAQIGAAIGREFPHALLAAVACKPEVQLNAALDRLLAAGLLFRQGEPPDATYVFKHALVQDAAHGTLLRDPRRALHARIAEAIESQFADIVERHPEILARHCTEAGLLEKAACLWGKAGQQSLDRVALAEAVAYLQEGLATVERLPPSVDRDGLEIALREPLHSARLRWRGWASPEVRANATAILQLTQRQSRPQSLVVGLWGMWINTITQGRVAESRHWAGRLLREGTRSRNIDLQILGHRASLSSRFYLGKLNKVLAQRDKVLALYDMRRAAHWRELTGNDVRTAVGNFASQALWMLGYPDQASKMSDQNYAEARQLAHPFDIGWALTWGSYVFDYRREPDLLLARVHEADRIGREQSIPVLNKVIVPAIEGLAKLRDGQLREAVSLLERGIEAWQSSGGYLNLPYLKSALAEALSRQGDFESGLRLLDECLDQIERPGWHERVWVAEVLRLKGWVLIRQGRHTAAKEQLLNSIVWARRQQARSWELRSSTTLAKLLIACDDRGAARQLLAPVYDWFTEGLDTPDLKAARALLADIS